MTRSLSLLLGVVGCAGPVSAQLPPDIPDPRSSYEPAVRAWMADGEELAAGRPGWATYRFSPPRSDVDRVRSELGSSFEELCRRMAGEIQEPADSPRGLIYRPLRTCMRDSTPLAGALLPAWTGELVITHLNASQTRQALAEVEEGRVRQAQTEQRRKEERKREAEQKAEVRAKLEELRANVAVGDRIGAVLDDRSIVKALVTEVRDDLVQVQAGDHQVWIKRDQIVLREVAEEASHHAWVKQQEDKRRAFCMDECTRQVARKCGDPGAFCPDLVEAREVCIAGCMDRFHFR